MDSATLPEIDTDLASRLEAAVPPPVCEWRKSSGAELCDTPASWIMSLSCGHSYYYDDEHAERMRANLAGQYVLCDQPAAPRHRPRVRVDVRFDRIES